MSGYRDPHKRALQDAERYRKQLRAAERGIERLASLLAAEQDDLIRQFVVSSLENPDDFFVFVGRENALVDGRVSPPLVEQRVAALLQRRPALRRVPRVEVADVGRRP